jgi:plastocyanin
MRLKFLLTSAILAAAALPAQAGDLHGRVACEGQSSNADAVVYVDKIPGKIFAPPKEHALIDQKNLKFVPHVLPVLAGTTVDFLNSDSVQHNVFSPSACAGKFNLGTYPKGEKRSYTFKKECFATLLCIVHPEMEAFVAVLPTPYFAVTAADGSYTIPNVPDGPYTVKVWHPKLKGATKTVAIKGATQADFSLSQ